MLDHVRAHDEVDRVVRERQRLARQLNGGHRNVPECRHGAVAGEHRSLIGQMNRDDAVPASHVENASNVARNHLLQGVDQRLRVTAVSGSTPEIILLVVADLESGG